MNAHSKELAFDVAAPKPLPEHISGAPDMAITPWGYVINAKIDDHISPARAMIARFLGMILVLASVGLWLVPDSLYGAEVFAMKLGAMIIFALVGVVLIRYGKERPGLEMQVDTVRRELRLGKRDMTGEFSLMDMLRFEEVASVYLLRNGQQGRPSRLYLRIGTHGDTGIEIARGSQKALDHIRTRLMLDLTHQA